MAKVRIQKYLSQAGVGSRRQIEDWIKQGEIFVNGKLAELGQAVDSYDRIQFKGEKPLKIRQDLKQPRILLYHKKIGEVCSRKDDENRPLVFDKLPKLKSSRWVMIGRLDINTSGLLVFTTDGGFANHLMHPSNEIEREYSVRVFGEVSDDALSNLLKGVELEDGFAKFEAITYQGGRSSNHWYNVTLKEGRNREVRRLWESQDVVVSRLLRIRFGDFVLPPRLFKGNYIELSPDEVSVALQEYHKNGKKK